MTIQFYTKISRSGIIKVPTNFHTDDEVEITIKHAKQVSDGQKVSAEEFISKWKGFLKRSAASKNERFNYLTEKYK